jgi:hypothetical protein
MEYLLFLLHELVLELCRHLVSLLDNIATAPHLGFLQFRILYPNLGCHAVRLTEQDIHEGDVLTEQDWSQLEAFHYGLKPFRETTLRTEGQGVTVSRGVIWKTLPTLNVLLFHVEDAIPRLQEVSLPPPTAGGGRRGQATQLIQHQPHLDPLLICYQNA